MTFPHQMIDTHLLLSSFFAFSLISSLISSPTSSLCLPCLVWMREKIRKKMKKKMKKKMRKKKRKWKKKWGKRWGRIWKKNEKKIEEKVQLFSFVAKCLFHLWQSIYLICCKAFISFFLSSIEFKRRLKLTTIDFSFA